MIKDADNEMQTNQDEDDDMALPNDADDMHKMLSQRREELKKIKEKKNDLKKSALPLMGNSVQSNPNLIQPKQSMSSLYELNSNSLGGPAGLESINQESIYHGSEQKKQE